jgi:hypothetical protein
MPHQNHLLYFTSPLLWQLADMRAPLHAPSDPSAVFHFIDPLIGFHTIHVFLLLTYTFSHSHETLMLPLLLP